MQENGWRVADCYIDESVSGTTFERGGFKRMIDDIEQGKINLVITKDAYVKLRINYSQSFSGKRFESTAFLFSL